MKNKILIINIFLIVLFSFWSCKKESNLIIEHLTCNFKEQPVGIDSPAPLLGWQIKSTDKNIMQSAFHIIVAENQEDIKNYIGTTWDSGKLDSEQSINIQYNGKELESGKRYFWRVKIWDSLGRESLWSAFSSWQTGLFSQNDWEGAQWISYDLLDSSLILIPGIHGAGSNLGEKALQRVIIPQFRKTFKIEKELEMATLSISGLGHYEAYSNGQKIGDSFLAPGWTDYNKTILYNTYDITSILTKGENVLGAVAGNGFYNINRERYRKLVIAYGFPKIIAHLKIKYKDGTSDLIVTDKSWKTTPSPITYSSIFGGEDYNAQKEQEGWNKPGFNDSGWNTVLISNSPGVKIKAENDYPVKITEQIYPQSIISLGDTAWLYDFGQNASGIIELQVLGKTGQQIELWPAELKNPDGTVNQRASGYPFYFSYTIKDKEVETWKPKFTYYGFRYVQVNGGVPKDEKNPENLPVIKNLKLLHTRNSSPENGSFLCSNDLLNQIYSLIKWAIKSNYQSVITDCPHREKLGWLEQTHLMGQGIHFSFDNYNLYKKQIFDMIDAQTNTGLVPDIAPEYVQFLGGFRDSPEWGSASVVLPYLLYKWYGDRQIIENAWSMMIRYVNYLKEKSNNHILNYGLGDWFDLGPNSPGVSQLTPISLTATAIYFYNVKIMAKMADLLEKTEKEDLKLWAEDIRTAFNKEFYNAETNIYSTGSQTAMAMPWCMGIPDEKDREKILRNLINSIIDGNKALTAGDVGFHYLVEAITRGGEAQLMFEMINRDDVPGYGYQLKKGATALTESWSALENVSNNHLMLGHVMEWFFAGLGGINQSEESTAYKKTIIEPQIVEGLEFVKTSFNSPYGLIRSEWEKKGSAIYFEIEIPHNTSSVLSLPAEKVKAVKMNGKIINQWQNKIDKKKNKIKLELNSGIYKVKLTNNVS